VVSLIEQRDHVVLEALWPYELIVIAAPSHRLAVQKDLTLQDLQLETWLVTTERFFAQAQVSLPNSLELGSIEAVKEGVIAGLGIAIVSRESATLEIAGGDLVLLDVQGFPVRREWFIVHLKERRLSLAADALRQLLLHS